MDELVNNPELSFFRVTPEGMMSRPPLCSSLQNLESSFLLVALARFPHALVMCASAVESAMKAVLNIPAEQFINAERSRNLGQEDLERSASCNSCMMTIHGGCGSDIRMRRRAGWRPSGLAVLRPRSDHVAGVHPRPADQGHSQETEPDKPGFADLLPPEPIETWHKEIRLLRAAMKCPTPERSNDWPAPRSRYRQAGRQRQNLPALPPHAPDRRHPAAVPWHRSPRAASGATAPLRTHKRDTAEPWWFPYGNANHEARANHFISGPCLICQASCPR